MTPHTPMTAFLVDALAKTTLLLGVVAIATVILRRQSAALRHLLWTFAIAGLVLVPAFLALSDVRLRIMPARTAPPVEIRDRAPASNTPPASNIPPAESRPRISFASASDSSGGEAAASITRAAPRTFQPGPMFFVIWLVGAAALLARFTGGFVLVSGIKRRARHLEDVQELDETAWRAVAERARRALGASSPVNLRVSDEVAMPFACGLMNPVIVLPSACAEWSTDRRDAVLMHEVAHLSRGDLPMNILSHVVRAAYWFHPLAWLAAYRLRVEGERACDDAVLRAGALPSDYAEHLLSIVRTVGHTVPIAALAMARKSDFEGRLLAILENGIPRTGLSRRSVASVALAFLAAVLPLAAMAPAPQPAVTPSTVTSSPATRLAAESETMQDPIPAVPPVPPRDRGGEPRARQQAATATVNALVETLADGSPSVRTAAVKSLGQLGDPRAIAALAKAMREDTDPRVREAAAYALGEIDDSRAVPALLDALKTERVAAVREKIVQALGEIDDPSAVTGISAVVKDASPAVRRAAVWALGELEDPAAIPALVSAVKDEDSEVRQHTAEALGQLKVASAMDALAQMTRDDNADVRVHAVEALGQLEDLRALNTLTAALKDANADVRRQAADAIQSLDGIKTAPKALIDALADPDKEVRQAVADALGDIEDEAAVPALKRATSDGDSDVRRAAAEALSRIGGADAIQALMGLLKDADPEIRRIAAESLGSKRH